MWYNGRGRNQAMPQYVLCMPPIIAPVMKEHFAITLNMNPQVWGNFQHDMAMENTWVVYQVWNRLAFDNFKTRLQLLGRRTRTNACGSIC